MKEEIKNILKGKKQKIIVIFFVLVVGLVYFFANPQLTGFHDHTYKIAEAFLYGRLGLLGIGPGEMVFSHGLYYSVFPLGSVLTMLPLAYLKVGGVIEDFPSKIIVPLIAMGCFFFCYLLTGLRNLDFKKRILLSLFPVLGTWTLTNLAFGGSWQVALGFAMVGQFGALYFTLVKKNYVLAGMFFALAFGNRTEVALLVFLFLYLIYLKDKKDNKPVSIEPYIKFLIAPAVLLGLTFIYNSLRFESFLEFGHSKLPGILEEPWYKHGIFSIHAIPLNFYTMLTKGWNSVSGFPFFTPSGFGDSILISSPFLLLLFRSIKKNKKIVLLSWLAIFVLTLVLFMHGNPGGWQFSYRYAMILIPWFFLILVNNSPQKITWIEIVLFSVAVFVNFWATYLFYWTKYVG